MTKGIIFDLLTVNNGMVLTLFNFFKIGVMKDNQGFGNFYTLMFAIHKLETSVSIAWRTKSYGEEKESQSKSETPTASA
tara:strand:+ start:376 stop:612 length:237 start_codon:yes stop_codon:yes gene_type:complete